MNNKYTGEVILDIQGEQHTICFDWKALAALKTKIDVDKIPQILRTQDPEQIAAMLACGLQKYHPGITPEKILEISPPLIPVVVALDTALAYSYFGASDAREPALAPESLDEPGPDPDSSGEPDYFKKKPINPNMKKRPMK